MKLFEMKKFKKIDINTFSDTCSGIYSIISPTGKICIEQPLNF